MPSNLSLQQNRSDDEYEVSFKNCIFLVGIFNIILRVDQFAPLHSSLRFKFSRWIFKKINIKKLSNF